MKLAIMQPYFFPYLGYFQLINAVDKFILYIRVNFIKEAWMNRNFILNAGNGKTIKLVCHLENVSSNSIINEVKLDKQHFRVKKLLKTIYLNYKRAPFFDNVFPLIEQIFSKRYDYLYELNNNSIIDIANYLKIKTAISVDEIYFDELELKLSARENYFSQYDKNNYPVRILRVFEICNKEGAAVFYNAIGGRKLYDKEIFLQAGIELGFLETKPVLYKQFNNSFMPHLSIIDVMMFNPVEKISEMLSGYNII